MLASCGTWARHWSLNCIFPKEKCRCWTIDLQDLLGLNVCRLYEDENKYLPAFLWGGIMPTGFMHAYKGMVSGLVALRYPSHHSVSTFGTLCSIITASTCDWIEVSFFKIDYINAGKKTYCFIEMQCGSMWLVRFLAWLISGFTNSIGKDQVKYRHYWFNQLQ